ncbi:MAG: hypothetical protein IH891_01620, partial [Planctomycetes bacterium]|nr:hypothetical protein [Planctomycetota bacterium]
MIRYSVPPASILTLTDDLALFDIKESSGPVHVHVRAAFDILRHLRHASAHALLILSIKLQVATVLGNGIKPGKADIDATKAGG